MSAITLTPYYSVVNASNGLWSDQISAIPVQSKPTIFSKTLPERGEQTEQMIFSTTLPERGEHTEQIDFS